MIIDPMRITLAGSSTDSRRSSSTGAAAPSPPTFTISPCRMDAASSSVLVVGSVMSELLGCGSGGHLGEASARTAVSHRRRASGTRISAGVSEPWRPMSSNGPESCGSKNASVPLATSATSPSRRGRRP